MKDLTAGTSSGFTLKIGTGVSFKEVRIGSEFGATPEPAHFTPPAAKVKVAAFSGGQLTNYKAPSSGLRVLHHLTSDHDLPGA